MILYRQKNTKKRYFVVFPRLCKIEISLRMRSGEKSRMSSSFRNINSPAYFVTSSHQFFIITNVKC